MAPGSIDLRFKSTVLVAVAAAAAVAGISCGGGDSSTPAGDSFWPGSYDSAGQALNPGTIDTEHKSDPGPCMTAACHASGGSAKLKLVYGGTVFKSDGKTPAANVQVGVVSGNYKSFVYSYKNGMYWAAGSDSVNWNDADIRIRDGSDSKRERPKLKEHARGADCDSAPCHAPSSSPLKVLP